MVAVLGGPTGPPIVPPSMYRRLAADLRANGTIVVADLSGEPLREALAGGVDVLKISADELADEGRIEHDGSATSSRRCAPWPRRGRRTSSTRAREPALALVDDALMVVRPPRLSEEDHRGAGDSLTAGIAATLASGGELAEGLRLGAAAGALNVNPPRPGDRQQRERSADSLGT